MLPKLHHIAATLLVVATRGTATTFNESDSTCDTEVPNDYLASLNLAITQGTNITKRQTAKHIVPLYINVWAIDQTIEGGYLTQAMIEEQVNYMNQLYAPNFFFDMSVDEPHWRVTPQYFSNDNIRLNRNQRREYLFRPTNRGQYDALNVHFVYRIDGSMLGEAYLPVPKIMEASNGESLASDAHAIICASSIPGIKKPNDPGSPSVLPHEAGHWLGLMHTDYHNPGSPECDAINDGLDDTPTHKLYTGKMVTTRWENNGRRFWRKHFETCPARDSVTSCEHIDPRPDQLHNVMVSHVLCNEVEFTDGQRDRMLGTYETIRLPYARKQRLEQGQQSGERSQTQDVESQQPRRPRPGQSPGGQPRRPKSGQQPNQKPKRPGPRPPQNKDGRPQSKPQATPRKGKFLMWIEGTCHSDGDCKTNCCAKLRGDQSLGKCSSVPASRQDGKIGCGFGR